MLVSASLPSSNFSPAIKKEVFPLTLPVTLLLKNYALIQYLFTHAPNDFNNSPASSLEMLPKTPVMTIVYPVKGPLHILYLSLFSYL